MINHIYAGGESSYIRMGKIEHTASADVAFARLPRGNLFGKSGFA